MKALIFSEIKRQEAKRRLIATKQARKTFSSAATLQRRASLVGSGVKWRITNLRQVADAMAKWA